MALTFASPYDGQQDVPRFSRIYARLSAALPGADAARALKLVESEGGATVPTTLAVSADGLRLVLTPQASLTPGTGYEMVLQLGAQAPAKRLAFKVAPEGPRTGDGLRVLSVQPVDQKDVRVWPFTTLHVLLSEPIRSETAVATGPRPSVRLVRTSTGAEVRGTVIARGSRIAFDPDEDLEPAATYRLELTGDIQDLAGEALSPTTRELTVTAAPLTRSLALALGAEARPTGTLSALDGRSSNTLELRSALVGTQSLSIAGMLSTQLPDLGGFGARVPLALRKGQRMSLRVADPRGLAISLYGEIPTGLASGPLELLLLTDAVGEISENPFSPGGRPTVRMVLDASLSAGDATVHTLLNQDLLHLVLSGTLEVEDGRLQVELVGAAQLELLGMETAGSSVTLAAASVEPVDPVMGTPAPLEILSTFPEDAAREIAPEQELRVVLSAPASEASFPRFIWLEREPGDGTPGTADDVEGTVRQDGSTVFFRPGTALAGGASYRLNVGIALRSATGAAPQRGVTASFTTRRANPSAPRPPMISALRPGIPCALIAVDGGYSCGLDLTPLRPAAMAADLPVELAFTRPVDPATVRLDRSFTLRGADGRTPVGRLEVTPTSVRFLPDEPLRAGEQYQLVINGKPDAGCGPDRICDSDGVALNTDVLLDVLEEAGGGGVDIRFTALPAARESAVTLQLTPISDLNANGKIDAPAEELREANSVSMRGADGGVAARTYLAGSLLAAVGAYDAIAGGVKVSVAPGSWMFGTTTSLYGIVTDRLVMRPAEQATGWLRAAAAEDVDRRPIVTVPFKAYVDSVNDTVEQALQREPLELELRGRLTFGSDGTLLMELTNANATKLQLLQGNLVLWIAPGDVRVRALSAPLKR